MRKLKLAIVLPIIQVLLASILLLWAYRTPTPLYYPTLAWFFCRLLNAPVVVLMGSWDSLPEIPFVGRGVFLISVGLFWHLVGRLLDRRGAKPPREPRVITVLAAQSLGLVAGVILLSIAWRDVRDPQASFWGAYLYVVQNVAATPVLGLIGIFLTLAWSVSLIFFSGRSLVRMIRRGLARSG
jgi:hypothetical protein